MKKRTFEFVCPHCGARFWMLKDTLLLFEKDSAEYRHLKDGTFFWHQCQNCRQLFPLSYPLLYRDPEKGFSLILSEKERIDGPADSIVIRCRRPEEFEKMFMILDLQVEIHKGLELWKRAEQHAGSAVILTDYDKERSILWFLCNDNSFGIRII